jgi:O-antigen/teichoic acid export membrane protein
MTVRALLARLSTRLSTAESMLIGGRAVGTAAAFFIGLVLVRLFEPAEVGTYKQFFLIFTTLFGLAQLGMAESLYYFIPRQPGATGRFVANAVATLTVAGGACLVLLLLSREAVAAWAEDARVAEYAPLLGLFVMLTLMTAVFEIVLVSRNRPGRAAWTYAVSDVARMLLIVVPALMTRSIGMVFAGAVAFAAIRLVVMLAMFRREFGSELRVDAGLWQRQLAYALPFAAAVSVEIVMINLHQYVVASTVDRATFAIYAVGCLQIPLIDLIASSNVNVLMVKMAEAGDDRRTALAAWYRTVSHLAFLLVPLTVSMVLLAPELIVGLFTPVYAASVPIFQVWALMVLPSIIAVDGVLRAYASTRFLLFMNVLRLGFVAAFIGVFLSAWGLRGAVLVTVLGTMLAKAVGMFSVARHLQVGLRGALPWQQLTVITVRAIVAAGPPMVVARLVPLPPLAAFALGAGVYGVTYAALSWWREIGSMTGRLKAAPTTPTYVGSAFRRTTVD